MPKADSLYFKDWGHVIKHYGSEANVPEIYYEDTDGGYRVIVD